MAIVAHRWKDGVDLATGTERCGRCPEDAYVYVRNRQGRDEREVRCPNCGWRYIEFTIADRLLERVDLKYHRKLRRDGGQIRRRLQRNGYGAYTVKERGLIEFGILEESPTPGFVQGLEALRLDSAVELVEIRVWEPGLRDVVKTLEYVR